MQNHETDTRPKKKVLTTPISGNGHFKAQKMQQANISLEFLLSSHWSKIRLTGNVTLQFDI